MIAELGEDFHIPKSRYWDAEWLIRIQPVPLKGNIFEFFVIIWRRFLIRRLVFRSDSDLKRDPPRD